MTPNEINEAIARSLGHSTIIKTRATKNGDKINVVARQISSEGGFNTFEEFDYYSSLDACAEFERSLCSFKEGAHRSQLDRYADALSSVIHPEYFVTPIEMAIATAPQRCEAYLKVKGLWK